MLPNGVLDYDLAERLRLKTKGTVPIDPDPKNTMRKATAIAQPTKQQRVTQKPRPVQQKTVSTTRATNVPTEDRGVGCPTSAPGKPCDDSYINLYDFLKQN